MKRKIRLILLALFLVLTPLLHVQGVDSSITFYNLAYETENVRDYEGIRIVVFFLAGCSHCSEQIDRLSNLEDDYNLVLFALSAEYNKSNQILMDYQASHSLSENWTIGFATNESLSKFEVRYVPTTIIIDDLDRIVAVSEFSTSTNYLKEKIELAINHQTDQYQIEPDQDNADLIKGLFIIIGTGVTVLVGYFVVQNFRKRK